MFYRVVLSCIILLTSIGLFGQTTDLLISEYGEGSIGSSKYIEIYNGTGATVSLANYRLCIISNGGAWCESNYTFVAANLADGATIVIANNITDVPGADEYSGSISWNGDDAVSLQKFSGTWNLLDVIGTDGADPGNGWNVAGTTDATKDYRLTRKATVCSPNTNWDNSRGTNTTNSEWTLVSYTSGAANSGHTNNCNTPCVAPLFQPTNLILSNVTFSSIDGAFTGTTADGYLVVQSTSSTLSGNPLNGTTYNAGDALGGGTVVYNGTVTNFSATGLNSLTTYYFFVFAYNNVSCTGAFAYNTTNPLTNNETTLAPPAFAADVVVSEYFNTSDPRDEWIEVVVVNDNIDLRNWTLRDNNSSTNSWQTAITFQNIAFWNNMRGGTIIKIWNRQRSSTDTTIRTIEIDKNDGYIELYAQHTTYFSGGSFGVDPTWGGSTLNYANTGDLLQLRDASGNHVHALGHDALPGSSWTSSSSPKVLRNNNMVANESVRVVGNNFANYNGGATANNSIVTQGSTTTSGLANDANNQLLWRTWREPLITNQSVVGNVCGTNCIDFTWDKMTDPLPSDDVQGYLILRKIAGESFTEPVDGTSYAPLSVLGDATVVANLDNPTAGTTVSYIDNLAELGTDEYRIYAYRYIDDNINGNSYDLARGRAYNTTNFVTVTLTTPLPIELLSFTGKPIGTSNLLEWATSTEINNDYFTLERSSNATLFSELATIRGAENSNTLLYYHFIDKTPLKGINYYRLKQTDFDGSYSFSNIIALNNKTIEFSVWNSANMLFVKGNKESLTSSLKIYNLLGELVLEKVFKENTSVETSTFSSGIYLIKIQNGETTFTQKITF